MTNQKSFRDSPSLILSIALFGLVGVGCSVPLDDPQGDAIPKSTDGCGDYERWVDPALGEELLIQSTVDSDRGAYFTTPDGLYHVDPATLRPTLLHSFEFADLSSFWIYNDQVVWEMGQGMLGFHSMDTGDLVRAVELPVSLVDYDWVGPHLIMSADGHTLVGRGTARETRTGNNRVLFAYDLQNDEGKILVGNTLMDGKTFGDDAADWEGRETLADLVGIFRGEGTLAAAADGSILTVATGLITETEFAMELVLYGPEASSLVEIPIVDKDYVFPLGADDRYFYYIEIQSDASHLYFRMPLAGGTPEEIYRNTTRLGIPFKVEVLQIEDRTILSRNGLVLSIGASDSTATLVGDRWAINSVTPQYIYADQCRKAL